MSTGRSESALAVRKEMMASWPVYFPVPLPIRGASPKYPSQETGKRCGLGWSGVGHVAVSLTEIARPHGSGVKIIAHELQA